MHIDTKLHKKKPGTATPYATLHIKPDGATSEVVEKDIHFGLFVIGTEKHDSRRIDNQLRGRAGRQGDPGASQFYVALDDEIMRKMGGDTIKSIAKRLLPADELAKLELTQSQFTSSIRRAQVQMEGHNFSIRKHLFDYDNVVNKQRMKIYTKRDEVLHWDGSRKNDILDEVAHSIHDIVEHLVNNWHKSELGGEALADAVNQIFAYDISTKLDAGDFTLKKDQIISRISELLIEERDAKTHIIADEDKLIEILRMVFLQSIDKYWIEHIDTMQHLREKVGLYGYAQQDPLVIYKSEGYKLYEQLRLSIDMEFLSTLFKIDYTQFHGMGGGVDFGIVNTNEEDFEDNLIGDMDRDMSGVIPPNSGKLPGRDGGLEVIDLAKINKQPLIADKKIGANEPCPCGSGKKYKKCHGA